MYPEWDFWVRWLLFESSSPLGQRWTWQPILTASGDGCIGLVKDIRVGYSNGLHFSSQGERCEMKTLDKVSVSRLVLCNMKTNLWTQRCREDWPWCNPRYFQLIPHRDDHNFQNPTFTPEPMLIVLLFKDRILAFLIWGDDASRTEIKSLYPWWCQVWCFVYSWYSESIVDWRTSPPGVLGDPNLPTFWSD